jgi:hypothetical protein
VTEEFDDREYGDVSPVVVPNVSDSEDPYALLNVHQIPERAVETPGNVREIVGPFVRRNKVE